MPINRKVAEICGWYGTTAIVLAYALVSFGAITGDNTNLLNQGNTPYAKINLK
jgi:hypothetical protein